MSATDTTIILISWSPSKYRLGLLKQTVASLRENTPDSYLLTVVDNGPQCQTDYLKTIGADTHIVNPVNLGPGTSRNQGAEQAKTPYIVFIDNDLRFHKGWLESSLTVIAKYPKSIVQPGRSSPMRSRRNYICEYEGKYVRYCMAAGWCLAMARDTFVDVGPFQASDVNPVEDREWVNRARTKGYEIIWPRGCYVKHVGLREGFPKTKLVDGQWQTKEKSSPQESNE